MRLVRFIFFLLLLLVKFAEKLDGTLVFNKRRQYEITIIKIVSC